MNKLKTLNNVSRSLKPRTPCIIKVFGGKYPLKDWIISHFDEHKTFVDICGGGASIITNKQSVDFNIYNDIDPELCNLLKYIKYEPNTLYTKLKNLEYTEQTFEYHKKIKTNSSFCLDRAVNEYVIRRMSRAGLMKDFAWSERLRGGRPGDENAWHNAVKNIFTISDRLQDISIQNLDIFDAINIYDSPDTLFYIDPPYLHTTRITTNAYRFEFNTEKHVKMAEIVNNISGKVIISGYPSELYDELFRGWQVYHKYVPNHSSQQKKKKTKIETLWINYEK